MIVSLAEVFYIHVQNLLWPFRVYMYNYFTIYRYCTFPISVIYIGLLLSSNGKLLEEKGRVIGICISHVVEYTPKFNTSKQLL